MPSYRSLAASFAAVVVVSAGSAGAGIIRQGNSGSLSAAVDFEIDGGTLVVRLTNISNSDVLVPAEVLTGVFFDYSGGPLALTPMSAMLPAGSVVHFGPDGGGNVSGEWAYAAGLVGAPFGVAYGISSSGLGLFGPGNLFPAPNLEGPLSPDGLNYGIVPFADNVGLGNAAVTGGFPLIQAAVEFRLGGLPDDFDLGLIDRVSFQYGTSLGEPNVPTFEVPAPGATCLLALGGLLCARRRR